MLKYILKRLLIFIPTLLAISLLTFIISINTSGDPVDVLLARNLEDQLSQYDAKQESYRSFRALLGLDKPVFYFTITTATQPDTLHKIAIRTHREALERIAFEHGNWPAVQQAYKGLQSLEVASYSLPWQADTKTAIRKLRDQVKLGYTQASVDDWRATHQKITDLIATNTELAPLATEAATLGVALEQLNGSEEHWRQYVPRLHWYGGDNQYHYWLFGDAPWFGAGEGNSKGVVRGDFGISHQTMQPVNDRFTGSLRWTVLISMISILLAFLTAVPLGVLSAVKRGTWVERFIGAKLFVLYSLPNFWVATLLLIYFAGGDHFDWFPTYGLGDLPDTAPFWDRFWETAWHLVLPIICWTYASLAFISRQMRSSMDNVLTTDFIRTARAKGLSERAVIGRHALRNSLISMITLVGIVFPYAVAGSIVIEHIFTIPGMGELTFTAYAFRDYPVVYTATLLVGALTLVGNLVADLLYAVADPRISFTKTSTSES